MGLEDYTDKWLYGYTVMELSNCADIVLKGYNIITLNSNI